MKVNNNIIISVGQAGVQIGDMFWKTLCAEHGIDPADGRCEGRAEPKGNWNGFFSQLGEGEDSSYIPRAIFVDLEPSVIDAVKDSSPGLYNPANYISSVEGSSSNFAVANQGKGSELLDEIMTRVSAEIEKCDLPGGIIMIHSLGGGTGSGLGCLVLSEIKAKYPQIPLLSAAIMPSAQVSSVVTEPYNAVFALETLKNSCDACIVFDNEALFKLTQEQWLIDNPTLDDLNRLVCELLSEITATMRYSGYLTVEISLRELLTNLVPQPDLHFLIVSTAPLYPPDDSKFAEQSVDEMTQALFSKDYVFAKCNPLDGFFLSTAVIYRGKVADKPKADAALAKVREQLPLTDWIPTAFKIGYVNEPSLTRNKSMVMIANNTAVADVLERICDKFDQLWTRKAFANWYIDAGMTDEDIESSRDFVRSLIDAYTCAGESGKKSIEASARVSRPEHRSRAAAAPQEAPPAAVEDVEEPIIEEVVESIPEPESEPISEPAPAPDQSEDTIAITPEEQEHNPIARAIREGSSDPEEA